MRNFREYVFVLWGDRFEELPATAFVTELRKVGLRVKVVGLTPQRINGAHGLALVPDLTLDQALPLAVNAACLIIPYASQGFNRLKSDPRVRKFFDQAYTNQATFVIGQLNGGNIASLELFPTSAIDNVTVYTDGENMVEFARELAGSLSNAI